MGSEVSDPGVYAMLTGGGGGRGGAGELADARLRAQQNLKRTQVLVSMEFSSVNKKHMG